MSHVMRSVIGWPNEGFYRVVSFLFRIISNKGMCYEVVVLKRANGIKACTDSSRMDGKTGFGIGFLTSQLQYFSALS